MKNAVAILHPVFHGMFVSCPDLRQVEGKSYQTKPNQRTPTMGTSTETNHPDAAPKKPASSCCLSSSTLPTTIVSRVPARQVRSGIITEGCKKGYPRGHNSSACEDGNDRAPWTMFQLHGSCRIHPSRSSLAFPLLRDTSDVLGSTAKHLDHAPSPRRCS